MKKVLLIMAAILLANAVSAQNYEKNILGVRAGLNLSSYSISAGGASISTDSRASFHVAVTDQILLCNKLPFYLETGLAFSSRGGKVDGVSFRPSYLQIPVLVNYHFNIKDIVTIQPFAGLYYGLGIGGKVKVGDEKGDIFGDEGGLKRSDLGVRLGAAHRFLLVHHALIGGVLVCDDGAVHFAGGNDEQIAGAKVVDLIFNIIRHAAVQKVIELQKIVRVKLHGAKIGVSIV